MTEDIERICQALALPVSAAQLGLLARYAALLQQWNATYNLSAVRDAAGVLTHHLADCLSVVPHLQRHAGGARLLDVGSGGGLPGVVIAAMLPAIQVTCIDAVAKKVAFVRHAAGLLPLANLKAHHGRVEAWKGVAFDVVTARAFATLSALVQQTRHMLAPQGVWMAMKGRVPTDEMAALPPGVAVFHVEHLTVPGLDAQRCLVWMRPQISATAPT